MPFDSSLSKTKGQVIVEYILLALCLCVIALRTTYTEGPPAQSFTPANLTDNLYTLSVSAVLFCSFIFWFIYNFCNKRFSYRFTTIEIGLCLFCIAATIAAFAASNKRAAITDIICFISPVLMAVLLVQILDSHAKIKLVLVIIAALGIASVYQCAEQFFVSNQVTIDQYEQSPQTLLEPFGIQPGSLQQFLFEHRLYSRVVRGFFTTSNSAGSFAILTSFAAIALFINELKIYRLKHSETPFPLITSGAAVAAIVFALIITRSKGAIAAFLIVAAMFVTFLFFGDWLKAHKKTLLLACLLLFIVIGWATIAYGLANNRLPGGNSMLVRWQYWYASAKMYADHWLTGVGPGNFAHFYTHYKPSASAESVSNPHNSLLSVLTQYGPLGLVGFLALFFIPLYKFFPGRAAFPTQPNTQFTFKTLAVIYLIGISAVLLLIRPPIMPLTIDVTFSVMIDVIFTLYVAPVIAFAVGFWLFTTRTTTHQLQNSHISAALFCAVLGLLLHNLIDYAIFEPPVFTAFCAIVACLVALDFQQNPQPAFVTKPPLPVRIIFIASGLLMIWGYFNFALMPVAKTSTRNLYAIRQEQKYGEYNHSLLDQATKQDHLDPMSPSLNGRLYLQHYNTAINEQPNLLKKAEACFFIAVARDKADFKNYEKLSDVYTLLAKNAPKQQKSDLMNKSLKYLWSAIERYPNSSDLRFKQAKVADYLEKTNIAVAQYEKAVKIEDAYRNQFRTMYPDRKILSRLGEGKYNNAKQRIKSLTGSSP